MTSPPELTVQSLRSHDFEEMRESFQGWDHEYDQIRAGAFTGAVTHFCSGDLQVIRNYWGNKIRYRGTAPAGTFGTALTLHQKGTGKWLGNETGPHDVVIQRPDHDAEFLAPQVWDAVALSMPQATMERFFRDFSGKSLCARDLLHGSVQLALEDAEEVRDLARALFARMDAPDDPNAQELQTLVDQVARRYALALVNAANGHIAPPAQSRSDQIAAWVEDYVTQANGRPVGILELCREIRVSERTLHYAFRKSRNTTPAAWIRTVRLNRAHRALRRSARDHGVIKQIAFENGFYHPSHFSSLYRRFFGELPSETQQRA